MWALYRNSQIVRTWPTPAPFQLDGVSHPSNIFMHPDTIAALDIYSLVEPVKPTRHEEITSTTYQVQGTNLVATHTVGLRDADTIRNQRLGDLLQLRDGKLPSVLDQVRNDFTGTVVLYLIDGNGNEVRTTLTPADMIVEANRKKDIHNQYDTHRQALEAETDAQALVDYDIEAGW